MVEDYEVLGAVAEKNIVEPGLVCQVRCREIVEQLEIGEHAAFSGRRGFPDANDLKRDDMPSIASSERKLWISRTPVLLRFSTVARTDGTGECHPTILSHFETILYREVGQMEAWDRNDVRYCDDDGMLRQIYLQAIPFNKAEPRFPEELINYKPVSDLGAPERGGPGVGWWCEPGFDPFDGVDSSGLSSNNLPAGSLNFLRDRSKSELHNATAIRDAALGERKKFSQFAADGARPSRHGFIRLSDRSSFDVREKVTHDVPLGDVRDIVDKGLASVGRPATDATRVDTINPSWVSAVLDGTFDDDPLVKKPSDK